ncbi:MAG: hypothetical protein DMG56_29495, partial [Acidobacteria bacterium]
GHLAPIESAIMFHERILERREIGSQVSKLTAKGSEVKMLPEQESGMVGERCVAVQCRSSGNRTLHICFPTLALRC